MWNLENVVTLIQDWVENVPISNKKEMMKMACGKYKISHQRNNICLVTCRNNGVVAMASNTYGIHSVP